MTLSANVMQMATGAFTNPEFPGAYGLDVMGITDPGALRTKCFRWERHGFNYYMWPRYELREFVRLWLSTPERTGIRYFRIQDYSGNAATGEFSTDERLRSLARELLNRYHYQLSSTHMFNLMHQTARQLAPDYGLVPERIAVVRSVVADRFVLHYEEENSN
jgi:hypothetical protein